MVKIETLPRSSRATSSSDMLSLLFFCRDAGVSRLQISVVSRSHPIAGSGVLPLHLVGQYSNLFDLELDGVAVFQIPAELKAAAIADRSGADEFTWHHRLVLTDMRNDLLE